MLSDTYYLIFFSRYFLFSNKFPLIITWYFHLILIYWHLFLDTCDPIPATCYQQFVSWYLTLAGMEFYFNLFIYIRLLNTKYYLQDWLPPTTAYHWARIAQIIQPFHNPRYFHVFHHPLSTQTIPTATIKQPLPLFTTLHIYLQVTTITNLAWFISN